jgi:hypothetical protein
MKIHITDELDRNLIEFRNRESKDPKNLHITTEDLADLKEHLDLDFMDELRDYHGCRIIIHPDIKQTFYE